MIYSTKKKKKGKHIKIERKDLSQFQRKSAHAPQKDLPNRKL